MDRMPNHPSITFTVRLHGVDTAHAIATAEQQLQIMASPYPGLAGHWQIQSVNLETDTWSMDTEGTMRWLSVEGTARVQWHDPTLSSEPLPPVGLS